jgi:hypothetical protein
MLLRYPILSKLKKKIIKVFIDVYETKKSDS